MTRILRLLAIILVGCAAAISAETIQVRGTVLNPVSGQPVAGALVVFHSVHYTPDVVANESDDSPEVRFGAQTPPETHVTRAVTDISGGFSFEATSPASMNLTITKQGFRTEDDLDTANVQVKEDHAQGLVVRMIPLSVIQGRVLNQFGDPLQGLSVHAVRIEIQNGKREIKDDYASKTTDDRGEYRMWDLSPGDYYVKVLGRTGTLNALASGSGGVLAEAYGPVYFPNNPDLNGARPLKIGGGESVTADFNLEAHTVRQIRGTLSNLPQRRQVVMRLVRSGDTLSNRAQVNLANGVFGVADVSPGSYVVQAYTSDTGPVFMGETQVTVGDADLAGVKIALNPAVDVSVRVDAPVQMNERSGMPIPRTVSVQAVPMDPRVLPRNYTPGIAMPQPDGNTVLKGLLPGKYEITVRSFAGQAYVASVTQGDTDVLADGLTVGPAGGQDVTVKLVTGGGRIQGKIDTTDAQGRWTIALFSATGSRTPVIVQGFVGVFSTQTIAPGGYNVYVWPASKKLAYREADAFQTLGAYVNQVSVKEGQNEITVKPIPAEAIQ